VRLLRGKDPGAILSGRYDLLDHFGRLSLLSSDQLLDFLGSLERLGVIETKEPDFPRLHLTGKGRTALKRRKDIPAQIPWPLPPRELPIPRDPELFSDLKKERNRIARDEGLPPSPAKGAAHPQGPGALLRSQEGEEQDRKGRGPSALLCGNEPFTGGDSQQGCDRYRGAVRGSGNGRDKGKKIR